MNLAQLLPLMREDPSFMENVALWRTLPARPARYGAFPAGVDARLVAAYAQRGVTRPYTHQAQAIAAVLAGRDVAVVTPTASGKTLCYNLPVLDAILKDGEARALYLFPTKALAADQAAEAMEVIQDLKADIKAFTYDGDTPVSARSAIRQAGHIVVTNPDMLHSAILPNHTRWVKLFENLKYIVIDEVHTYRGLFGSHMANVIRRLLRICAFYGARPQFICCSATIANPGELAGTLTGREMTLIDDNGAPMGEKHVVLYNPPVVNPQLGIRKSSLLECRRIATRLIDNHIQTIVFARSRLSVEVMVNYLKQRVGDAIGNSARVRGYRGGYLPTLRREIERGLRRGEILGVVSTNALELGIDIGQLDACVLCGYPGTIASTWQQAGRAGRRQSVSATFLVANSSAMDQYIMRHPEFLFDHSPEHGRLNPDNLYVLMSHLKCAAFELPFREGEEFAPGTGDMLDYLTEQGLLRKYGDTWHWSTEDFPASDISLRSATNENFTITDISSPKHRVIGEMDRFTVPMLLHERAIYLHEGQTYQVEELDFDNKKAYIRRVEPDYYTDADVSESLKVLEEFEHREGPAGRSRGEVAVTCLVSKFKKIRFDTHENVGWGPVTLPEWILHTAAYWMTLSPELTANMSQAQVQNALVGIANLMGAVAPVYLMCGAQDIRVVPQVRAPETGLPTIFIYESCPGGAGFSEKLFALQEELLAQALEMVTGCGCEDGCPACVGAGLGRDAKADAARLLRGCLHG